ncbi:MAG: hypothetical protein KJ601_01585 [Nanoarchaeota archaeon]|nr:hypothetical protein [Nanoarchaeota archaeon]MBU1704826.1 hypothetical protein [Nanoarchaeota archaeon]
MQEQFNNIKQEYENFYRSLVLQGKFAAKDTGVGFWGPAVSDEILEAFKRLKIKGHFLDLGSGDGKVAMIASLFCERVVGIEYDPLLVLKAQEVRKKFSLLNVSLKNQDYFEHDISHYDYVFVNPDKPFFRGLDAKLETELRGRLIVYSNHFFPSTLRLNDQFKVNDTTVSVYSR